jgi:SAM-dependent methyltransferase
MSKKRVGDNGFMQRIPEPELMDAPAQARAYAEADFDEPNSLFVDLFGHYFPAAPVRRILDLGCGPGDILVRFARYYPDSELAGVDGSAAMLDHARAAVTAAGLSERVRLVTERLGADALAGVPPLWADAVISNSLLHHLADPMVLWEAVKRHGDAGAAVLVMDLFRPPTADAARAIVSHYADGEPEVLRTDFYNSLCAAFRIDEVQDQLARAGLAGLTVETASDRHLVVHGYLP